jgi:hypothetical protein
MKRGKKSRARRSSPKHSLSLPDLDQARSAVLNSLPSKESQRGYRHAIDEFIQLEAGRPEVIRERGVLFPSTDAIGNTFEAVAINCAATNRRSGLRFAQDRVRPSNARTRSAYHG